MGGNLNLNQDVVVKCSDDHKSGVLLIVRSKKYCVLGALGIFCVNQIYWNKISEPKRLFRTRF